MVNTPQADAGKGDHSPSSSAGIAAAEAAVAAMLEQKSAMKKRSIGSPLLFRNFQNSDWPVSTGAEWPVYDGAAVSACDILIILAPAPCAEPDNGRPSIAIDEQGTIRRFFANRFEVGTQFDEREFYALICFHR
jgi:hypothetical protein